jgi:phosphate/sulfate permease
MAALLVTVLIAIATIAGVAMVRRQEDPPQLGRAALVRLIAYWLSTVFVAFELAAGALWAMPRIE